MPCHTSAVTLFFVRGAGGCVFVVFPHISVVESGNNSAPLLAGNMLEVPRTQDFIERVCRYAFEHVRISWKGKNYFSIVTFAVGAIFIASPVSGVTTTSSMVTVA